MPRNTVPINGAIVKWARGEAGLTPDALAESIGVHPELIEQWEEGSIFPTKGQFTKLACKVNRPSAVFFLQEPPSAPGVATTFRNAPGLGRHELEQIEIQQIRWASRLQEIAAWVLQDLNRKPANLRVYSTSDDPVATGALERKLLGIPVADQLRWKNPHKALAALRRQFESLGVFILQLSLGKNNIRGFSMWNEFAPIVAINESYHPTARVFTILHEYGHLVTRGDAACFDFIDPAKHDHSKERWCERFAAAFLLPSTELRSEVSRIKLASRSIELDLEAVKRIASRYSVSIRATAMRLEEMDLVEHGFYQLIASQLGPYDWNPIPAGERRGGERAVQKRIRQFGERITSVLVDATDRGRLSDRDISDLLKLNSGQIDDLKVSLIERA